MKAVCSFSGGLDSMLAAKIIIDEGIDVEGLYFKTGFGGCGDDEDVAPVIERAEALGMKLTIVDVREDLLSIIKSPKFGFGKNMNPCMDCHSLFFRKCAEYMKKLGASFIITGEVVGERPMSQRKWAMREIDEFTGLKGLILRPLSGNIMEETIPEKKGWVKREKLFGISGRSRKPQRQLAEKFGIKSYPNAAGGCLLTEKDFSRRLRDLMKHKKNITVKDVTDLRSGRHFRLPEGAKLVLGRDEKENLKLLKKASPGEICFMTIDVPGPVGVLSGKTSADDRKLTAEIIAAYSDSHGGDIIELKEKKKPSGKWRFIKAETPLKKEAESFLV